MEEVHRNALMNFRKFIIMGKQPFFVCVRIYYADLLWCEAPTSAKKKMKCVQVSPQMYL